MYARGWACLSRREAEDPDICTNVQNGLHLRGDARDPVTVVDENFEEGDPHALFAGKANLATLSLDEDFCRRPTTCASPEEDAKASCADAFPESGAGPAQSAD
jgi:hypothetical protein